MCGFFDVVHQSRDAGLEALDNIFAALIGTNPEAGPKYWCRDDGRTRSTLVTTVWRP